MQYYMLPEHWVLKKKRYKLIRFSTVIIMHVRIGINQQSTVTLHANSRLYDFFFLRSQWNNVFPVLGSDIMLYCSRLSSQYVRRQSLGAAKFNMNVTLVSSVIA